MIVQRSKILPRVSLRDTRALARSPASPQTPVGGRILFGAKTSRLLAGFVCQARPMCARVAPDLPTSSSHRRARGICMPTGRLLATSPLWRPKRPASGGAGGEKPPAKLGLHRRGASGPEEPKEPKEPQEPQEPRATSLGGEHVVCRAREEQASRSA